MDDKRAQELAKEDENTLVMALLLRSKHRARLGIIYPDVLEYMVKRNVEGVHEALVLCKKLQ